MRRRVTGVRLAEERWSNANAWTKGRAVQWRKWIIAALCCPGGMQWAGSLRRSETVKGACRDRPPGPVLPGVRRRSRTYLLAIPRRRRHEASRVCERRASNRDGDPIRCRFPRPCLADLRASKRPERSLLQTEPTRALLQRQIPWSEIPDRKKRAPLPHC